MHDRDNEQSPVWCCVACGTHFERGVAADYQGQPRCPQCGLTEAVPIGNHRGEFVITRGTKFR